MKRARLVHGSPRKVNGELFEEKPATPSPCEGGGQLAAVGGSRERIHGVSRRGARPPLRVRPHHRAAMAARL